MNKRAIASLGIIVLLVIVLLAVKYRGGSPLPALSPWEGTAGEILISREGKTLRIYREGDGWKIGDEGYPADREAVANLEKSLNHLVLTDLIAEQPPYGRYDLSPERAVHVKVKSETNILREIQVGKASSTQRHTYVRLGDSPAVYLASGNLAADFRKSIDDLRDRQIANLAADTVQEIDITLKGKTLRLKKRKVEKKATEEAPDLKDEEKTKESPEKTVQWYAETAPGLSLDQNRVNQFLAGLTPLKAAGYPAVEKKNLKGALCAVMVKTADGSQTLNIYQKNDDNRHLCAWSGSPYVFTMDEWQAKKFMKGVEDFREAK